MLLRWHNNQIDGYSYINQALRKMAPITLQDVATVPVVLDTPLVESSGRSHTGYSRASCHLHFLENATHLAGTGVQVPIYMGQMQPASSSVGWSVDARCDSHTDFHFQQKIEYKSGFNRNDYKKVVYLV